MSDPHGFIAEHFPNFYLWLQSLKTEAHFLALGMVASRDTINPSEWLKIICGVIFSAFLSSYVTAGQTIAKFEQKLEEQERRWRLVEDFMKQQREETVLIREKLARNDGIAAGMQGMSGMNNGKR